MLDIAANKLKQSEKNLTKETSMDFITNAMSLRQFTIEFYQLNLFVQQISTQYSK